MTPETTRNPAEHWTFEVMLERLKVLCLLGVTYIYILLGGGFKYVLFPPLPGEDSHFDDHIFQLG